MATWRVVYPSIPFELYRPIFEHTVSSNDLCALARTSRAAQAEAERLLYSHLEGNDVASVVAACRRICNLARVRSYVQSLVLHYDEPYSRYQHLHSFYALVAQALYQTPNLIRLVIRQDMESSFRVILCHLPISKLWKFKLRYFRIPNVDHTEFTRFLPDQHDIRYLHTDVSVPYFNLVVPPDLLPRLTCLKSYDYATVPFFLSTRAITHLYTTRPLDEIPDPGAGLQVRALHCTFANVMKIPDMFPRLELLSFDALVRTIHGDMYSEPGDHGWGSVKHMLSRLGHLRRLAFISPDNRRSDIADVVTVLTTFHGVCPTLQFVRIVSKASEGIGMASRAHPWDWAWNGKTWVGLFSSEILDIWEQSAMEVTMSGIPGISIKLTG